MILAKFKVGDKVFICEDIQSNRYLRNPGIDDDMLQYQGREAVISECFEEYYLPVYKLENIPWNWGEKWLSFKKENNIEFEESEFEDVLRGSHV